MRAAALKATLTKPSEIAAFWRATTGLANPVHRDLLRFLLLTGQRRTETVQARWSDIEGDIWTIPAINAKTGVLLRVPLGPLSMDLLSKQQKYGDPSLVFPGKSGKQIAGYSQLLKPMKQALGIDTFAFHALRRSYRTGLDELGVAEPVAEMMIGHARPDLVGRYSKSELWNQRLEAQQLWEAFLGTVIKR